MPWPWYLLLFTITEEISAGELSGVSGGERVGGPFKGKLEVGAEVAGFHFSLAGFEVSPEGKIVMLVEVFGLVEGLLLFRVLLQQLALEARQIVHQYIYYNATSSQHIYHPTAAFFLLSFLTFLLLTVRPNKY